MTPCEFVVRIQPVLFSGITQNVADDVVSQKPETVAERIRPFIQGDQDFVNLWPFYPRYVDFVSGRYGRHINRILVMQCLQELFERATREISLKQKHVVLQRVLKDLFVER